MILRALYDYYHSLGTLPSAGMEMKEIAYVVVINGDGRFVRFESTRVDKSKYTTFIVPKGVVRTSAPKSNILWDNGKYVLGAGDTDGRCNRLFVDKVKEIAVMHPDDISIQALLRFYELPANERVAAFEHDELYHEINDNIKRNFSFRLEGDDKLIAEKTELYADLAGDELSDDMYGICLITGRREPLVRLTSATPVQGGQATASLVAVQIGQGYDSYGKSQAFNSPISKDAEFAYTSALKMLLSKESRNKKIIGGRTYLFWGTGEKTNVSAVEDNFMSFLGLEADKNDPNECVSKVHKLFNSIWSGQIRTTLDDKFYILGLAPNAGRIAVVSWSEQTLKDFAGRVLRHFDDMELTDCRPENKRRPYCGIMTMLEAVTPGGKVKDSQPNLSEGILGAIIRGTPYPYTLYTGAVERIRAELADRPVTIARAAIIKAYINRSNNNQINKKLKTMLDKENNNPGYLCGRLAAVLEKVQEDAKSGDTIRTRYMSAASATPSAVFPTMLNLSVHHSEKLNEGSRIRFEQIKQEIIEKMPSAGFPAHLDLNDQGRFFVGYYHQRADFFTKKENKE